eukprot:NP_494477.1 Uncharacterized protein CELE_ZC239.3 [Caenorhabditis elegans]
MSLFFDKVIRLNIGGKRFDTHKSTLMKFDGYFKKFLQTPGSSLVDPIFVDRSPTYFDIVLNFMRKGRADLPETLIDLKMLLDEAEYYELTELCDDCKREISILDIGIESEPFHEIIPEVSVVARNNNNAIPNNVVEVGS